MTLAGCSDEEAGALVECEPSSHLDGLLNLHCARATDMADLRSMFGVLLGCVAKYSRAVETLGANGFDDNQDVPGHVLLQLCGKEPLETLSAITCLRFANTMKGSTVLKCTLLSSVLDRCVLAQRSEDITDIVLRDATFTELEKKEIILSVLEQDLPPI